MPDITMCRNKECISRESCYRFKAHPSDHQNFGAFPLRPGEVKCSYFWPIEKPTDQKQPLQKKEKKRGRPKKIPI